MPGSVLLSAYWEFQKNTFHSCYLKCIPVMLFHSLRWDSSLSLLSSGGGDEQSSGWDPHRLSLNSTGFVTLDIIMIPMFWRG